MATVRSSPHRWWVLLVTMAGSVPAFADASAHEIRGKVGAASPAELPPRSQRGPKSDLHWPSESCPTSICASLGCITVRFLCCRDLPPAHIVVVPWDANDDAASDGDDTSDGDDSQDDQSGDDDTESQGIACTQATSARDRAECATVTSWFFPSLLTS